MNNKGSCGSCSHKSISELVIVNDFEMTTPTVSRTDTANR